MTDSTLRLRFPKTVGAAPGAVPPPDNYLLTVGSDGPKLRTNAAAVAIAPRIDGVLTPPQLMPDGGGSYTVHGVGLTAAKTDVRLGDMALTPVAATPAAGQFQVAADGSSFAFKPPGNMPAGRYFVGISVNQNSGAAVMVRGRAMSNSAPLEFPQPSISPVLERVRLRARRHAQWMRHLWTRGMSSTDQGLAITHGEVDRLLLDPGELAAEAERFHAGNAGDRALREAIARADRAFERDRDWSSICACFALNGQDSDLLSLAVAADLDPGLGRVYGYLHDEAQACHATQWLAAQLFEWPPDVACGPDSNLVFWRLAVPSDRAGNAWSARAPWIADPAIALSVKQRGWCDPALLPVVTLVAADPTGDDGCLYPDALARMQGFVQSVRAGSSAPIQLEILGPPGSGKRTLAAQFAVGHGRALLIGDAEALFADKTAEIASEHLVRMLRMARAAGAIPYWRFADAINAKTWRAGRGMYDLVMLDRDAGSSITPSNSAVRHSVRLAPLARAQRLALWTRLSDQPAPSAVRDRMLLPGEIAMAARVASGGDEAVRQACAPLQKPPPDLLQPLPAPYSWEDSC